MGTKTSTKLKKYVGAIDLTPELVHAGHHTPPACLLSAYPPSMYIYQPLIAFRLETGFERFRFLPSEKALAVFRSRPRMSSFFTS